MSAHESTDRGSTESTPICPIVGVGASAGGLAALTELLEQLPIDTGMAFVLIQHLDPHHESLLTRLLAKTTAMPVVEIVDGMEIVPDRVYVIPPAAGLLLVENHLQIFPREQIHGRTLPIDRFFHSLATYRQHRAIAVVLSGTAGDGSLGLVAVKAAGGITFAQDPASAKFSEMPDRAVATGCVDFILPPAAIAAELAKISRHDYIAQIPPPEVAVLPVREHTLATIFTLLRNAKGLDFTKYKPATLQRRMLRRMALHNLKRLEDYADYLHGSPLEIDELYRDLLINVTSFFRDSFVFDTLACKVFPALIQSQQSGMPIRIWSAGCSTGEEAYSLAIALLEYLDARDLQFPIQIFATDISDAAIERARVGIYPLDRLTGVATELRDRYFIKVEGGYQIGKSVRELCIFARQNLIADPPFSQLDLISCRNVLIYLSAELQQRLIPIFHYALKPNGTLMLGTSETIGEFANLFEPIDKKAKLYTRKQVARTPYPIFSRHRNLSLAKVKPMMPSEPERPIKADFLQQAADRIVLDRSPVGAIVTEEMEIVEFRGQTGAYLEPAAGKPSFNLFKMAKPDLVVELRAAIHQAKQQNEPVRHQGVLVQTNTGTRRINLEIVPFTHSTQLRYFLVLFEDLGIVTADPPSPPTTSSQRKKGKQTALEQENQQLHQKLAAAQEYLQASVAEQDSNNDALQVANEEILSSNEELQSTNEELETSQEELQATNEELHTINEELHSRNGELGQINNDLQNLLSSINIPILMLDGELKIRRFTPLAQQLFNLIPTDLGRPFNDIQSNLVAIDLGAVIQETIDTLIVKKLEVQDRDGHWYSLRVRPYRTLDNRIDGATIGLFDIDTLKRSTLAISAARDYANAIVETVRQPLLILSADLRVIRANRYFYHTFALAPAQVEQQSIFEVDDGAWDLPNLRSLLETILTSDTEFQDFEIAQIRGTASSRSLLLNARQIREDLDTHSILLAIEDITDRRQAEAQILNSLTEKEVLLREIHHRVTNNLQIISSMLSLHSNRITDPQLQSILQDSQNRVRAMALIHEILYKSTNLAALNFTEYLQTLVNNLFNNYAVDRTAISLRLDLQPDVTINIDTAVLCGSIVNELVTNALKHGFAAGEGGEVAVTLAHEQAAISIAVIDNGRKLAADFDLHNGRSMGLNIVLSLIEQLKGNLAVESGELTVFRFRFPDIGVSEQ